MEKPVEPRKQIQKRVAYSCDSNMSSILEAYDQIKKLYPTIFDSSIKYDYYNEELITHVRMENPDFEKEYEQYNKDLIQYFEFEAKKELKKQVQINKKEIKDKRRAARIAANQSESFTDKSIIVIDNKKYKVLLVED